MKSLYPILIIFLIALSLFTSCEDDDVLEIQPLASLKLDISLNQTKHEFPNSFNAYVEIQIINDDGTSIISQESDSIAFVKQLNGNHSTQSNINIPINKNVLISMSTNIGEYNLFGCSDTIKVGLDDQEIQIVDIYLTTGNIIIEEPVLLAVGTEVAIFSTKIIDEGTSKISECGFVWNTTTLTTIDDNIGSFINSSDDISSFQLVLEDLNPGTTYYISSYAINADEIAYSNQLSFTTTESTDNVVLFTNNASNVGPYTATLESYIVDDGDRTIAEKGFVWATYTNPEVGNNEGISTHGGGVNSFNSNISGLTDGTVYYARSYAEILEGEIYYGNEITFTTVLLTQPEGVESGLIEVLLHTAQIDVTIDDDGGLEITSKGVVYSQTPNPTIDINEGMTNDGTGIDDFTCTLTGLTSAATYYARSYAINDRGVTYSDEISFLTLHLGGIGPGGGIIFVDGGDNGGMEVGDISTEVIMQWGCASTATGATYSSYGSGLANTITIVDFHNGLIDYEGNPTQCSGGNDGSIAAKYCYEFSQNGYDDWYLPSRDELSILFANELIIGITDFNEVYEYASSTEEDANNIKSFWYDVEFVGGSESYSSKENDFAVRPVRKF